MGPIVERRLPQTSTILPQHALRCLGSHRNSWSGVADSRRRTHGPGDLDAELVGSTQHSVKQYAATDSGGGVQPAFGTRSRSTPSALATPMGQPGAMTLYAARPSEHLSFAETVLQHHTGRGLP